MTTSYIVDFELSMTLVRKMVLDCLKRAFKQAKPEIINSNQGGQCTNEDSIKLVQSEGIQISMDEKGLKQ